MTISNNRIYQEDENGEVIDEVEVDEGVCPWDEIGMCRGCWICSYGNDN